MSFLVNPFVFGAGGGGPSVGLTYKAAVRASLASDQSVSSGYASNVVDWDAEDIDDGWGYDPATDNGLFTVPSGVEWVSVSALTWQQAGGSSTADAAIGVLLNGTRISDENHDNNFRNDTYMSMMISVSAGDEIEIEVRTSRSANLESDHCWVSIVGYGT